MTPGKPASKFRREGWCADVIDLDSGTLSGGRFWRFTPMVNWYLSDHVRLEAAYGYGSLNRFGLVGVTQFLQTRLQLQL